MTTLRATLTTDGTSDRCLLHPIRWIITEAIGGGTLQLDLAHALVKASPLEARIQRAVERYPCDLLLVHRDAENQDPELRYQEVADAIVDLGNAKSTVCVVPVRMTEAWLLFDEPSIRAAADNPSGPVPLDLPRLQRLETVANPKRKLREAILTASEQRGRRRDRLRRDLPTRVQRVAELIDDFSPLRTLAAFSRLERDISSALPQVL